MDRYKYEPLPSEGHHIRLLRLPQGEKTGEIACTVFPCLLSEAPKYEAVSYCWGLEQTQITCGGKSLTVPLSLPPFLLRTRAKGRERILWIDSICIDQGNKEEKASQVREMHNVYRKATRTLIWLGPESGNSTLGLEFATTLRNLSLTSVEDKKLWRYRLRASRACSGVFSNRWAAFFELFERPWFGRAWIVQEAVLSSDPVIICGDKAISWPAFVGALYYTVTDQPWIFEFYGTTRMAILTWLYQSQWEVAQDTKRLHYEVLLRHRQSVAFDPRDTVFAFRGLSGHASFEEHSIIPDYIVKAETLFLDIAASTLSQSSNLDFLSIPRLRPREEGLNVPSWVADWSCSEPACNSLLKIEHGGASVREVTPYNSTKGSLCEPKIDKKQGHMKLLGYTVDTITSICECWEMQDTRGFQSLRKQAMVLQKNQGFIQNIRAVIEPDSGKAYLTGETLHEVMWHTCMAGFFPAGKEKAAEAYAGFESRQRILRIIPWLGLQDQLWTWLLVVIVGHILRLIGIANPEIPFRISVECMANRRIFKTDKGYIGIGPGIGEVGDKIALVKGGKMPFVVRPKAGEWELIGDAYVHGIMNGELWVEDKCLEVVFN